jgi:hypothetical protein
MRRRVVAGDDSKGEIENGHKKSVATTGIDDARSNLSHGD